MFWDSLEGSTAQSLVSSHPAWPLVRPGTQCVRLNSGKSHYGLDRAQLELPWDWKQLGGLSWEAADNNNRTLHRVQWTPSGVTAHSELLQLNCISAIIGMVVVRVLKISLEEEVLICLWPELVWRWQVITRRGIYTALSSSPAITHV